MYCFGKYKTEWLIDTLEGINEKTNPLFYWLATEGPKKSFLDYAIQNGYALKSEGYYDKCQLCFDMRKHLIYDPVITKEIGPKRSFQD